MLSIPGILMIAGVEFPFIHSLKTEESWKMLTDTCSIEVPRKVKINRKPLTDVLKVRDEVTVDMSYFSNDMDRIFTGVIARSPNPTIPVGIECEDAMFLLKQNRYAHQWKNASLKDIIEHVAPGVEHNLLNATIGKYTIPGDWNAARVFEDLKSNRGLYTFFRDGKLQVGLQYDPSFAKRKTYDFEQNIISHQLEFFTKEDLRLKVKAISIGKNNKKTTVEVGDSTGEERTLHFYDLSETEMKAAAEREMERMRYDGYRGSFTTFGKPYARHGDIARLVDDTYDRGGDYWIDKVERSLTVDGGYRQTITLGPIT